MSLCQGVSPGGSHAPAPRYARPPPGPQVRTCPAPGARPAPRLPAQGHRRGPLVGLLLAAARLTSLHAVCRQLRGVPSDETVRQALYSRLPDFAALQRQLNDALAGRVPKALRCHPQRLAIDLTLVPYHGEPFRDAKEVHRARARDGTKRFHAYATAYVVRKGRRYTVALAAVAKGGPLKDVVQRLLRQARSAG